MKPLQFSPREAQVIQRIVCGWTNDMIARDLGMTEASTKQYVRRIIAQVGRGRDPVERRATGRGTPRFSPARREIALRVRQGPADPAESDPSSPSIMQSIADLLKVRPADILPALSR